MADEIVVDTQKLRYYGSKIDYVNSRIKSIDRRMNSLYAQVGLNGLLDLLQADVLTGYSVKLSACKNALVETCYDIETKEKELKQCDVICFPMPPSELSVKTDTMMEFIGKAGHLGGLISGVYETAKPVAEQTAKSIFGMAKSVFDLGEEMHDFVEAGYKKDFYSKIQPGNAKRATDLFNRRLVGLDDKFKGKASSFRAKWVKNPDFVQSLQNFKPPFTDGWGTRYIRNFKSSVKTGFSNISASTVVFTAIGNGIDNYDEMKEKGISRTRAAAETAVETVVDIGKNILIGSAVAATVAATFGSAPVLLVGATTVIATMGLDWVSEQLTDEDVTENISDLICNVGEGAVEVGKTLISGVTDIINDAGNLFGKVFA